MSDPLEFTPAYVSPLTEKQHAQIGRIALLWGQIEHSVETLLPLVSGLTWAELETLGLATKSIASKADFLTKAGPRLKDKDFQSELAAVCAMIHETKTARNHVFHGIWGWRATERTKTVEPAARKTATPQQPFKASQLPALEKKLCKCSRMAFDLTCSLWGADARYDLTRFFHHDGETDAPIWLQQWSERNPMGHDVLDRNAKAGQLPRLSVPYPEK